MRERERERERDRERKPLTKTERGRERDGGACGGCAVVYTVLLLAVKGYGVGEYSISHIDHTSVCLFKILLAIRTMNTQTKIHLIFFNRTIDSKPLPLMIHIWMC